MREGSFIKDNDPRMGTRTLRIISCRESADHVLATPARHFGGKVRQFKIQKKRIFSDGKPRKYGFNLI